MSERSREVVKDASSEEVSRSIEDRLLDVRVGGSDEFDGPVARIQSVEDLVDESGVVRVHFELPSGYEDSETLQWPDTVEADEKFNRLVENDDLPFTEASFSTESLYGEAIPVEKVDETGDDWQIRVPDNSLFGNVSAVRRVRDALDRIDGDTEAKLRGVGYACFVLSLGGVSVGLAFDLLTLLISIPLVLAFVPGLAPLIGRVGDEFINFMSVGFLGIGSGVAVFLLAVATWGETATGFIGGGLIITTLWICSMLLYHKILDTYEGDYI